MTDEQGQNANAEGSGAASVETLLPEGYEDHMVSVKVDGQDKQVPISELIRDHQKSLSADERFRAAHEERRAHEAEMDAFTDLAGGIRENDPVKLRRAMKAGGATDEQLQAMFNPQQQEGVEDVGEGGEANGDGGALGGETALRKELAELRKSTEVLMGAYTAAQQTAKARTVRGQVDQAIDSDPELSTIINGLAGEGAKEDARQLVRASVSEASQTIPWGSRAIQSGLDKAKAKLKGLGVGQGQHAQESSDVGLIPGAAELPGLGPAGYPVSQLHQSTGKTKTVRPRQPGYVANLGQRLLAGMRKAK